jgi:hypothetical protein
VKRGDVVWVRGVVTSAYDDQNFAYTISNDPAVKLHIIPAEVIDAMAAALRDLAGRLPDDSRHFEWAREKGPCSCFCCVARAALAAFDASRGGKP